MLQPPSIIATPGSINPVISGYTSGVRVQCAPGALPDYKALVKLAQSGNHWARLGVSGIADLSAGRLHMNNVFVKKAAGLAYGRGAFHVVLPGLTATFEQLPNSSYILLRIQYDRHYFDLQQDNKKPGLWKAEKSGTAWNPTFIPDGNLDKGKRNRFVVVSDADEDKPEEAAELAGSSMVNTNATMARLINSDGFDLHFTPGKAGIGGLKNARQALMANKDADLHESAILLAKTMSHARDIEGVLWFSNWGGSGVITQAMQILADQGIKLDKHGIFLYRPTTQPSKAIALGLRLGLTTEGKGQTGGLRLDELVGRLGYIDSGIAKAHRLKHDQSYGGSDLASDVAGSGIQASSLGLAAIGLGATVGVVGTSVAASPVVVGGGAILAVYGITKSLHKNLRRK